MPKNQMYKRYLLCLVACDAVVGDTGDERTALRIEVNEQLTVSHLHSLLGAQMQARGLGRWFPQ